MTRPSSAPTTRPSSRPTKIPTTQPSKYPVTAIPTSNPSFSPTNAPTILSLGSSVLQLVSVSSTVSFPSADVAVPTDPSSASFKYLVSVFGATLSGLVPNNKVIISSINGVSAGSSRRRLGASSITVAYSVESLVVCTVTLTNTCGSSSLQSLALTEYNDVALTLNNAVADTTDAGFAKALLLNFVTMSTSDVSSGELQSKMLFAVGKVVSNPSKFLLALFRKQSYAL